MQPAGLGCSSSRLHGCRLEPTLWRVPKEAVEVRIYNYRSLILTISRDWN